MLCHCVTAANRTRYARQLDQMFAQRHEVFVDGLGWRELRRDDHRDVDDYDTDDTVYLLVIDDTGEVVASTRMNPTYARHQMEEGGTLRKKFVHRNPPAGPTVWEGSRLVGGFPGRYGRDFARETLGILFAAIQEFCVRRGVTEAVSIFETKALSKAQSLGWETVPLGLPVKYDTDKGEGEAISVIWKTGVRYILRTRQEVGIIGPVLYEAPPVLDDDPVETVDWALLASASELRTPQARLRALTMMHQLLTEENLAGIRQTLN